MHQKEEKDKLGKKGIIDIGLKEPEFLDIIASEVEDKFGGKKWYWLTPEGKKVAEYLVKIEEVMEER